MTLRLPRPHAPGGHRPGTSTGLVALLLLMCTLGAQAQLARKPSYYDQEKRAPNFAPRPASAGSAPIAAPASLPALTTQAEFDQLARVYDPGTPLELAHVLFAIDRRARPARIYYINTPRFALHTRFVRETGLQAHAGKREIDNNYLLPDRRFLFGTLSWQQSISAFTYEFWEGDQLTAALLRQTDALVAASFFQPVRFKSNSTLHERRAAEAGVRLVTQEALIREQPYLPLNPGRAVGRLRIIEAAADVSRLRPDDIAVLRQVPLSLPPVAGVLTERASTALSHVNLLVKGWGVPNAYVRDAAAVFRAQEGQWVELDITASRYTLRRLSAEDVIAWQKHQASQAQTRPAGALALMAQPDLRETRLQPLAALGVRHQAQCGAKASNLGALMAARIPDTEVPDGFCIPFAHYARFMRENGLAERLSRLTQSPGFESDPQVRQAALAQLREDIVRWPVDPATAAAWRARWQSQLGGAGVFVRSSSNSEDLPGFSGAGLYTTVPNVKTGDTLEDAVKKVWASVFNTDAWEARRAVGAAPDAVFMAVLVQTAVDSVNAGVMVTRDPYDATRPYITTISAKRGIGIRVVEGQRQAEQVMYSSWSKAIQVISRSDDPTALQLDAAGGVKEVTLAANRSVLTDALVLRLAATAAAVKRVFKGVEQDIEWATVGDRIVLLQARPYVERHAPSR